uniref:Uncharacterized protein n=1 Tax=Oreochromis aureus TaxID=47969 RepID=A0AAZ1XZJ0_OREAU
LHMHSTCSLIQQGLNLTVRILIAPLLQKGFEATLLEYAGRWRVEEEPLPLVKVYTVALLNYAHASPYLSLQCENVSLVVERLSLSFLELILSLKDIPHAVWNELKSCVQFAHSKLKQNGIAQLSLLSALGEYDGVWSNRTLQGLLSNENLPTEQGECRPLFHIVLLFGNILCF